MTKRNWRHPGKGLAWRRGRHGYTVRVGEHFYRNVTLEEIVRWRFPRAQELIDEIKADARLIAASKTLEALIDAGMQKG